MKVDQDFDSLFTLFDQKKTSSSWFFSLHSTVWFYFSVVIVDFLFGIDFPQTDTHTFKCIFEWFDRLNINQVQNIDCIWSLLLFVLLMNWFPFLGHFYFFSKHWVNLCMRNWNSTVNNNMLSEFKVSGCWEALVILNEKKVYKTGCMVITVAYRIHRPKLFNIRECMDARANMLASSRQS